ncbi:MAG: tetratricopeptide repeat protein [Treponema sp.]|nr:tetratricopeptide repeat protein [Treponema sp.]
MAAVVLATVVGSVSALSQFAGNLREGGGQRADRNEILRLWEAGLFSEVHSLSREALMSRPLDYFLLTMHGFSAYQLGISQANSLRAALYFDDSIRALRKAMLLRESERDGRLFYVLGKAYFYKGDGFSDSAIRYLERARALGHTASDIPEFLGLAYAAIGDYRNSVIAFAEALQTTRPSALLLLSIAESYIALEEFEKARAYLMRCIAVSMDFQTTITARLFLADVLRMLGDHNGAIGQLMEILEEAGENAEARFQLGELYALQGDNTRARAEWRRAVSADPTHLRARARLSL